MTATLEQVREAVRAGRITPAEGAHYIEEEYRKPRRQRIIASAFTVIVIMLSIFLINPDSNTLTGNVVIDASPLQNDSTMAIDTPVTMLTISGTLYGEGNANVWLDIDANTTLHVAAITSDDGTPRTDKAGYTAGEIVVVQNAPDDATYYLDDGMISTAVSLPFSAPENDATLLVVATEENGLVTYRLPIHIGAYERETVFENLCDETCAMAPTIGTLRIEKDEGVRLDISEIKADVQSQNNPPTLTQGLPPLSITAPTTLDLAPYFTDVDGDTLLYSTGLSSIATLIVDGNMLTITPIADGNETVFVYASDLKDLVQATLTLTVTLPANTTTTTTTVNDTNETTMNATTNETTIEPPFIETNLTNTTDTNITIDTNHTINLTDNTTMINGTNASIDCSDPDPNKRPIECIQGENSSYFRRESLHIQSKDGISVGEITAVGNLLIRGTVVEISTGTPSTTDYQLGYLNENGDYIPTIWINSVTGDLHLRGRLVEANGNIPQQDGWTTFISARGIVLAQAHRETGDLTVRGNLVPYRRTFG